MMVGIREDLSHLFFYFFGVPNKYSYLCLRFLNLIKWQTILNT